MLKKWENLEIQLSRKNDLYTYEEILGSLDQYSLQTTLPLLNSDDIIVDLGAHIGLFSLAVSNRVKKVISIEPNKENYDLLCNNISRNGISNIITINKAIGKKNESRDFYTSNLSPARHSFYKNPFLNGNGNFCSLLKTPVITLEKILEEIDSCKILKADIEGAEYETFFNCPEKVLKKIKYFFIEYHNFSEVENGDTIMEFFSKMGFKVIPGINKYHRTKVRKPETSVKAIIEIFDQVVDKKIVAGSFVAINPHL